MRVSSPSSPGSSPAEPSVPVRATGALTRPVPLPYTRRVVGKCAATLAFLLTLSIVSTPCAEHEVSYRFTVLGYVKDAQGKGRPGIEVELVREKTGFSYIGETDRDGLYVIVARLGDESAGERLRLRAATQSVTVIARFSPDDHVKDRGTRVDFVGPKSVETPTAFAATLKQFLAQ